MLNLMSLLFGMASWGFALYAMAQEKKSPSIGGSFFCCSMALLGQLAEIARRAMKGDFSGIEDTIGFVMTASAVLLTGTVILNLVASRIRFHEK